MTAPQTLATIFALISIGSALVLALMASASAALDALAVACDRSLVSVRDDRPRTTLDRSMPGAPDGPRARPSAVAERNRSHGFTPGKAPTRLCSRPRCRPPHGASTIACMSAL